jgi:hypothetical protein
MHRRSVTLDNGSLGMQKNSRAHHSHAMTPISFQHVMDGVFGKVDVGVIQQHQFRFCGAQARIPGHSRTAVLRQLENPNTRKAVTDLVQAAVGGLIVDNDDGLKRRRLPFERLDTVQNALSPVVVDNNCAD